ncbi:MAG: IMP dehydrogenase [Nanoarchaeota archaeon]|nr:IMP dehydrogenase [Nanoarchaeota archaeon]
MNDLHVAMTFDDVRLKTSYSEIMPDHVSTETKFSKNVPLKIPIVSAAMDTVTEHELAIELAKLGGIGIIHRNLNPEEQAFQVARVKNHLNGLIENPICVNEEESINDILEKRNRKGYGFHTFPVLDKEGKLIGILTENDFDLCDNFSLPAKEVMTAQLITSPLGTTLEEAYNIMTKTKKKVLPLVNNDEKISGMYVFSDVKRIKSESSQKYNIDARGQLRVGAAIGTGEDTLNRVKKLVKENIDVVVIDTAHGDSKPVIETLKMIKEKYPSLDVVTGNVSEPDSVRRLIEAGSDGVKIGQGPGSICTTRVIAGVGCPQVTAIYNCSLVADEYGIPICADGGLRFSGDITIAIGAGAHCIMLGSMLAGIEESPGEIVFWEGRQWKNYRGMGSIGAMQEHKGSRERYGQKDAGKEELIPEGVEGLVPYKGKLKDVIFQYVGGLKNGMGYVGASTINELREKADFMRLSVPGQAESHPHHVKITKESPNYSGA